MYTESDTKSPNHMIIQYAERKSSVIMRALMKFGAVIKAACEVG
jgi:hypothetical protein